MIGDPYGFPSLPFDVPVCGGAHIAGEILRPARDDPDYISGRLRITFAEARVEVDHHEIRAGDPPAPLLDGSIVLLGDRRLVWRAPALGWEVYR